MIERDTLRRFDVEPEAGFALHELLLGDDRICDPELARELRSSDGVGGRGDGETGRRSWLCLPAQGPDVDEGGGGVACRVPFRRRSATSPVPFTCSSLRSRAAA